MPFGDGSWKPSSIGSVEVTDTFFTVEKGKLISPDGVRIVAVYALDGSVCNPDTLTEGACYVVRAISSRGECIAQKIIVPQL